MYTKLFGKILDSSIWLEPVSTRIVWITLLAAMDQDGYAHFSAVENLANRARVTNEEAEKAVECFLAPDANSANPENDGKRIERVPGGYFILNAAAHRSIMNKEIQREQTRIRTAKWRERKNGTGKRHSIVTRTSPTVTPVSVSVSDSVSNKRKKLDKETVFKESSVFEFEKFREGLKDWPEEKVRHYHKLFGLQEKYKYKDWCLAARRWDEKTPWQKTDNKGLSLVSLEEGFRLSIEESKNADK